MQMLMSVSWVLTTVSRHALILLDHSPVPVVQGIHSTMMEYPAMVTCSNNNFYYIKLLSANYFYIVMCQFQMWMSVLWVQTAASISV